MIVYCYFLYISKNFKLNTMEVLEGKKELTEIEKAQLLLQEETANREKVCFEEMIAVLDKYNCDLTITHSVNDQNQIQSQIKLFAKLTNK